VRVFMKPESEIEPRRYGRGRPRHLMNLEALNIAGHDEPKPRPEFKRDSLLRLPMSELKPAVSPQ
jgi:hypothetical protein